MKVNDLAFLNDRSIVKILETDSNKFENFPIIGVIVRLGNASYIDLGESLEWTPQGSYSAEGNPSQYDIQRIIDPVTEPEYYL